MRPILLLLLLMIIVNSGLIACGGPSTSPPLTLETAPPETTTPLSSTPPEITLNDPANPDETTLLPEITTSPPTSEPPALTPIITEPELYQDFKVVGYISHWRMDRISDIKLEGVTHLIWQGVEPATSNDPTLVVANNAGWWQITEAVTKGHAGGAKVLVSLIGFWKQTKLNNIWESAEKRAELIKNLKELVESYGLDGIDIDNENKQKDQVLYTTFIKELYKALSPMGKIITVAGNPYKVTIAPEAFAMVEFINLMTYDMSLGKGYPYHSTLEESIQAIRLWAASGIPREKLLMGIPVYGRDTSTFMDYERIVAKYNPAPDQNEVSEPTAAGGIIWWNGIDLTKEKVFYVIDNDYGGIMLYELGWDTQDGSSLLGSVFEALEQLRNMQDAGSSGGTSQDYLSSNNRGF